MCNYIFVIVFKTYSVLFCLYLPASAHYPKFPLYTLVFQNADDHAYTKQAFEIFRPRANCTGRDQIRWPVYRSKRLIWVLAHNPETKFRFTSLHFKYTKMTSHFAVLKAKEENSTAPFAQKVHSNIGTRKATS